MPTTSGPNTNELGLVFSFDTGDISNSYLGEPSTNLLPNPPLNSLPTYGNSWGTYNTNQYCGNNGCAVYWSIPAISTVSNNIVTTVSDHQIRSFDVINPETTGGGVTAGTQYLAKKISNTQFSLHEYNSSQDGSEGFINPITGGFKVHDSYWFDQRIDIDGSNFPTKWFGNPHQPNSAIVKEIIPNGFDVNRSSPTDCIRLHWFRTDATDGMAYGVDAGLTIGQPVTVSFWARAVSSSAVGQHIGFQNYNYGGIPGANSYFLTATWGAVGEWVRNSYTFTPTHSAIISYWFPSSGGMTVDIANIQVEQKSHVTPFTIGSRSNTGSLIDLARANPINLASVSFDSTADIVYDGTDDFASVTLASSFSVHCLEMVWYNNNAIPNNDTAIGGPTTYQTPIEFNGNGTGVHLGAWTGSLTNEAIHIWAGGGATANQVAAGVGYHHVVFNWNMTTYDIWLDGVKTPTQYLAGYLPAGLLTANSIKIGNDVSGYAFNGKIPVTKIYNQPLLDSQIYNNYLMYKTRFSI
jgi:hypothetical protein